MINSPETLVLFALVLAVALIAMVPLVYIAVLGPRDEPVDRLVRLLRAVAGMIRRRK
jgi:hypothetical protein